MIKILQEKNTDNAITVLLGIPEFVEAINHKQFALRLQADPIILVAYSKQKAVACKIGYDRFNDGTYYSWLGGVLPKYRNKGIALKLTAKMEQLAKEKGYTSIVFKTRNKFKAMLQFALKNRYNIIGFEAKDNPSENKIILKKKI